MNVAHLQSLRPIALPFKPSVTAAAPPSVRWRVVLAASLLAGASLLAASSARAESGGPSAMSEGSLNMAAGSIAIVAGSPLMLVGVPDFTIIGVEHLAKGLRLTVKGTAQTAGLILLVPAAAAVGASVVVGGTITVVATATGWLLSCGGQALGYIARDAADSLLFSEPASDCCPSCCNGSLR